MKERYLGKTIKEWTSELGCSRDRIYAIKKRNKCSLGEAVEMIRSGSGRKKKNNTGIHSMGRIESAVLKAWKRGERSAEEISEITGYPLNVIDRYVPVQE